MPVSVVALKVAALAVPVTFKDPKVPTVVILGWDAVCNVPVMAVALMAFVDTLPNLAFPVTFKVLKVPIPVMFG